MSTHNTLSVSILEKKPSYYLELLSILSLFSLTFWFYSHLQDHISFEAEPLLDAHQYLRSYFFFNNEFTTYQVDFPFHTRIAIPFLASIVPSDDVIFNFKLIHFILLFFSIIITQKCFQDYKVSFLYRIMYWLWLFFHWVGPLRYGMHEPIQVDSACFLFASTLLLVIKDKIKWLLLIIPISVLFKENLIPIAFILGCYYFIFNRRGKALYLLSTVVMSLAMLYLIQHFFPMSHENWRNHGLLTIIRILKMISLNPLIIIRWIAACFVGCSILLIQKEYKKSDLRLPEFWIFIGSLILGLIAGGDHSRILFSYSLFIWIYLAKSPITTNTIVAFLLSIPLINLFSTIPDVNETDYNSWFPAYTNWKTMTMLFSYVCGAYFLLKVTAKIEITLPKWLHSTL